MSCKFVLSLACVCLFATPAFSQSIWTGNIDDDWAKAGNWTNGVPSSVANRRAHIQKTTDTGPWPVIRTNITQGGRIQAPAIASGVNGTTMYGRLTIASSATVTVGDDFLFGDANGTALQPMVGSLDVAGSVSVPERMRFGRNDFMTLDVSVTGSMTQTVPNQDFVIGTGASSDVLFAISGNGVVSVGGDLEMDDGGLLTLVDNGRLILNEYVATPDPPVFKPALLALVTNYIDHGFIKGVGDVNSVYSGPESLTFLKRGVAYFEGPTSITFVAAIPEPATVSLMLLTGAMSLIFTRRRRP